jgi:hypothetical protein
MDSGIGSRIGAVVPKLNLKVGSGMGPRIGAVVPKLDPN